MVLSIHLFTLFRTQKKCCQVARKRPNPALNQWLSEESLVCFGSFLGNVRLFSSRFEQLRLCVLNLRVIDSVKLSVGASNGRCETCYSPFHLGKICPRTKSSYVLLFHWAITRLKDRYTGCAAQ